jgi:hypothetical protein
MSINYNPSVVTSGLVLCLDAGNPRSYPGTGTNWFDLSGNNNNSVLTNGPTYSSADNGNLLFDGVDDYSNFFAANLGSTTTVEVWCKLGSYNEKMLFGWNRYDVYFPNGTFGYNTGNGDSYGISNSTLVSLGIPNNWKHFIFEMRSDVSYTNNKIFVNGTALTLSQQLGSENAASRNFNSGNGRISGWRFSNQYFINMNLSIFRVYNRGLTTEEIQQNFNAMRGRYGI